MQQKLDDNNLLCDSLKAPLENCLDIFDEFMMTLQTYTQTSRDGTRRVRIWKKITWAFKDKEIQLFRDTILTYKASLNLAAHAATLLTTTSIDERTKRMEADFKKNFNQIQSKLEALEIDRIELISIAEEKGSEWHGTNAYFALNRFLEYTASLYNSPPVSFPGSPIGPPSNADDETDIPMEIPLSGSHFQDNMGHRETVSAQLSTPSLDINTNVTGPQVGGLRRTGIYSKSGFDLLRALQLVATRKDPKISLGEVDLSCAIVVCDTTMNDCPVIYASDAFQNLTGYNRHEIIGQNCRFLQAPDGKVEAGTKREFVDEGTVFSLRTMVQLRQEGQQSLINYRKGGKPFLNLLTILPIPWDTDEIRYLVGFLIDLVESPEALSAPPGPPGQLVKVNYKYSYIDQYIWTPPPPNQWDHENGQTLSPADVSTILSHSYPRESVSSWSKQSWDMMLLENSDDMIHVLSLEGIFLYISPSCKRILEYDAAELVGIPLSSICHPFDVEPVTQELQNCALGNTIDLVFRIRQKHSGFTYFESRGSSQGSETRYIILIGRKRPMFMLSRRHLELDGGIGDNEIWAKISTSGILLFVSSNIRSLLDLQASQLVGTSIQDLVRKELRPEFGRSLETARWGAITSCHCEITNRQGQVLQTNIVLYPGNSFPTQKPLFLLARIHLPKESRWGSTSTSTVARSDQDTALPWDDNIFSNCMMTTSSWQSDLAQIKHENEDLMEELNKLLSSKKKRKRA
ncbi:PAS domain-containing protein [Ilyonectria robusta]|uniref:PAS domain-containing protein n=1 Tax=Ilyonectria robusta TaxID=1079257 RepID=UPI001E8DB033|nr:PAS domain-containing protein [Ilyonectria robusta]KAH8706207.1 PAS domain-containing protein [Ilyonectria robusta]